MTSIRGCLLEVPIMSKKVLVPIATCTEELEAVTIVDVLRRAGADVTMASVEKELRVFTSRNVVLLADAFISDCENVTFDLVVLPGGMPGAERLRDCETLRRITEAQAKHNRLYGGISAAPAVALEPWGLLKGMKATCHPTLVSKLIIQDCANSRVVKDGHVVTSRGPGTAMEFALSLMEELFGREITEIVSKGLIIRKKVEAFAEFNPKQWPIMSEKPQVLVVMANGSEEMEAVTIVSVLRQAGMDVVLASAEDKLEIVARRGLKLETDKLLTDVHSSDFDAIFLPGGVPGAERLRECNLLTDMLTKQVQAGRVVGAICVSPAVVLHAKNILEGKKATSFPPVQHLLSDQSAVSFRVVVDGLVATSQSPGSAMEFAFSIVEKFLGKAKSCEIAKPMLFHYTNC